MNKCPTCGNRCEKSHCFKHMPRKPLKRAAIKKSKLNVEREYKDNKMWELFLEIWKERPHKSEVSGKWLGNEPLSYMFDHLLEKETYPNIKYEKWNIALVTLEEHDAKGMKFPLPKHKELIDKAYELYQERLRAKELSISAPSSWVL